MNIKRLFFLDISCNWVCRKLINFTKLFFLDKNETLFVEFARKNWRGLNKVAGNQEMLIEVMKYHPYIFQIAYQSNFLANKYQLKIRTVINSYDAKNVFINKYLNKYLSTTRLFCSFAATPGLNYYSLSIADVNACKLGAAELLNNIKNKADLLNLKIEDIHVGDLVYDTHLRLYKLATIDINDSRLLKTIENALVIFTSCKKYLNEHNVKLVVMLHAVYIQHAILVRLAIHRNISVYLYAHREGRILQKLTEAHFYQSLDHHKYREIFSRLENKQDALKRAYETLSKRVSGEIDVGISYMKTSAYKKMADNEIRIFRESNKSRVVIFLHCFFDSPHIYRNMLFEDFYEWLDFTLRVASSSHYDCYVKPHPNGLNGNEAIVSHFKTNFPQVTFIDKFISNRQLIDEGFDLGVTLYGTIAHELAYQGIPVVAAGDNPHADYSFCFTAKSIQEYENVLRHPHVLSKEISKTEIEQFFYMHYLYQSDIYKNSVGNWEQSIRKIQQEVIGSKVLNELILHAQNGEFNETNNYFNDVLRHVNSLN